MKMPPQQYLVVDDDTTSNLICKLIIKKFNPDAGIELFADPQKALEFIETHYSETPNLKPTLLFLDVNMPVMSGFEFLDEYKKFDAEIRDQFIIYMLSSSIEDFNSQSLIYPCVSGFLTKPLRTNDLEEIFRVLSS